MSTNSRNSLPVILLFGPTAAGKTDLIAALFREGFEVINADSEHVYRGLDIGTAKPDRDLLKRVPHHLIDILEPIDQFTVGDFVRAADRLAADIAARGRVPVVSGGAAFYLKHFVFGLPASPPSIPAVREAVKRDLERKGSAALHDELRGLDPAGAAAIHPADAYRVSRALEVIRQTGRPLSFFKASSVPRSGYDFLFLGLAVPREELKERIGRRVEAMFAAGLTGEIKALTARGYNAATPALRGIGYREFFSMKCSPIADIKEAIKLHSLQYAKRQMTFFRSMPGTRWFHPSQREEIRSCVRRFIASLTRDRGSDRAAGGCSGP